MANHFRSSERQGDEDLEQQVPLTQQDGQEASADQSVVQAQPAGQSSFDASQPESTYSGPAHSAHLSAASSADSTAASSDDVAPAMSGPASVGQPDSGDVSAPMSQSVSYGQPSPQGQPDTTSQAPLQDAGIVVSEKAAQERDITSQQGFTSVFAPLQDDPAPVVSRTGKPTISLRSVTLIYPAQPNKPALEDVSLDIYPGEFVFVVGHSGSGKSTFLRLLTRELRATSGKVNVAGQELTSLRNWKVPYLRRQIGTVYQDFKLLPDKTVYENVAFALECIGKPRSVIKAQVPEVLRLVGLAEKMDNYPDQLSGGEQQRVSVARAMVNRPPLLVCDEPTGNLDPAISLGIMKLLDRINRTGTTVVMATHDREMVDSMRKRVIALEGGHVVRDQERGGYGYYGAL